LNLINTSCPSLYVEGHDFRLERRVNLCVAVLVVPLENGRPRIDQSFAAVSREFSNTGVSLVLSELRPLDEVILAFRRRTSTTFVLAKAKHLSPMGAGFFQLGLKMLEVLPPDAYPELETLANRF
jgi:hypothetical protein